MIKRSVVVFNKTILMLYIYIYIYIHTHTQTLYLLSIILLTRRETNIWKSDLPDEIKQECFQTGVLSLLLYSCSIWTLIKHLEEKARCELQKDFACYFEPILEASPYKTAIVQSLISHLKNHPSKTCWALLEK